MIPDKLDICVPCFSKAAGPSPRLFHVRRVCGGFSRLPPPRPIPGDSRPGAAQTSGCRARRGGCGAAAPPPAPLRSSPPPRRAPAGQPCLPGRMRPGRKEQAPAGRGMAGSPLHHSSAGRALSRVFSTRSTVFPLSHPVSSLGTRTAKPNRPALSPPFVHLPGQPAGGGGTTKLSRLCSRRQAAARPP